MKQKAVSCLLALGMLMGVQLPVTTAQPAADTYITQPGDSLWKIAVKYQVGLQEMINANRQQFPNPNLIHPGDRVIVPLVSTEIKSIEARVVQLVNQERAKAGLAPLKANWELSRLARMKSQDMRDKNYFSHQSPTYGSPFDMMKNFGVTYLAAGENIAAGQTTAQAVMNGWMNSPGHRQNILSPNFTQIGVGYATGGSYRSYWTQMFIRQ